MYQTPGMTDLARFIAGLPKAELHVHHVGSASPRIVAELAARHEGASPVPADPALLADYFTFTDFGHFIEVYLSVVDLIRDPAEDIWTLTYEIARDLAAQNVRYAELTLTPYSSIRRAASRPRRSARRSRTPAAGRRPTTACSCGGASTSPARPASQAADVTLDVALRQRPDGLVSFGLGGPEQGVPRRSSRRTSPRRGGGPAQRAARGGVDRARDDLGRAHPPGRRTHRARHRRRSGSAADGAPARPADPARGLPDLERLHPLGAVAGRAPAARSWPPGCRSRSTPTTRPCSRPRSTASTRWRPHLLGLDESGVADLARAGVTASFLDAPGQAALLAEIDAYANRPAAHRGPCASGDFASSGHG